MLGPIPEPSPRWPTQGRDCQATPQQGTSQSFPPPPKSKASPEGRHPFVVSTRMCVPRGRAHHPRPLNPTASTARTKAAWPVPCSVAGRDHPRAHTLRTDGSAVTSNAPSRVSVASPPAWCSTSFPTCGKRNAFTRSGGRSEPVPVAQDYPPGGRQHQPGD